jgi:hypothetical protein
MPTPEERYQQALLKNRERQRRFYEANKEKIKEKKKLIYRRGTETIATDDKENTPPEDERELPNDSELVPLGKNDADKRKEILKALNKKITDKTRKLDYEIVKDFISTLTHNDTDVPLAETTKGKYAKNMKQFFNLYKKDDLREAYDKPQTIISTINESTLGILSKVDIFTAILKLLNGGIYPKYSKQKYDLLNDAYLTVKKESDIHRKNKVGNEQLAVDNIDTLTKLIQKKFGEGSKEDIILQLYREVPKRDDFYLEIVHDEKTTEANVNYVIVPKQTNKNVKIFIKRHKTDGKYKPEIEPLSSELSSKIRAYINSNELADGDYLFREKKLGPFIKTMFGKINKPAINGSTELRKIIVSNVLSHESTTIEQAQTLANTMKHNIQTQQLYKRPVRSNAKN